MDRQSALLKKGVSAKRESRSVDFKGSFDPTSAKDQVDIIKDIVAMTNSGGGIILFGVNDNGTPSSANLAGITHLDPAVLTDKIFSYTHVQFADFEVREIKRGRQETVALIVLGSATPLVFEEPGTYPIDSKNQKTAFSKGTIYFRHGAKSEPARNSDLTATFAKELERTRKLWFDRVRKVAEAPTSHVVQVFPSRVATGLAAGGIVGRIVSDTSAPGVRPTNADEQWPHRQKDVLKFVLEQTPKGTYFTGHDVLCLRYVFHLDQERPEFIYKPFQRSSPQYSDAFVAWVAQQIKADSAFLAKTRAEYKSKISK